MSKEQIYQAMKSDEYLPGIMRWRVGSFNEHQAHMDHIRYNTPDGRSYVVEYHTHEDAKKTFSDVYDIIEINPVDQLLRG